MNINFQWKKGRIEYGLQYGLMMLMVFSSSTLMAQQYSAEEYNQKLNQYIAIVNSTKTVLDNPEVHASAEEQKKALCQRIEAYKNIVKISQANAQYENAPVMKLISQSFLDKQKASFEHSGVNEASFCALISV